MDDTLEEIENELKRLSPRGPSTALGAALDRELGPAVPIAPVRRYASATTLGSWKWASWSLGGIAALAAFALIVYSNRPRSNPGPDQVAAPKLAANGAADQAGSVAANSNRYEPLRATSILYDWQEGEATTLPDRTEGREVRFRYVDTYTWKNPSTNASLRWSVPRDEVRLIRASLD